MARVGADGSKYPPTEFSQKYAAVLSPKGKLVSPKDVFGEEGCFDKGGTAACPSVAFLIHLRFPHFHSIPTEIGQLTKSMVVAIKAVSE